MTPVFVFLDASTYEAHSFQFSNEPLASLGELLDQGHARLLIPKIAHLEVLKRIDVRVSEMTQCLREARNRGTVFKGTQIEPLKSLFGRETWPLALKSEIEARYRDFVGRGSEPVSAPKRATTDVFSAYFNAKPPFDLAEKKHEFPDAFVMAALREWQRTSGEKVWVISADKDFKRTLGSDPGFSVSDNCEAVLRHIYGTKIGHNASAVELVNTQRRLFSNELKKAFGKHAIYLDEEPLSPRAVRATSARTLKITKIEVNKAGVGVRFETRFHFTVTDNYRVAWSDPSVDPEEDDVTNGLAFPVHEVFGKRKRYVTLPTYIRFQPTRDMKGVISIRMVEINDGVAMDLRSTS